MPTKNDQPSDSASAWQRVFAQLYDPVTWVAESVGMRQRRAHLLCHARGRVLELGSGTGVNLPHYPRDVKELILTEPDPAMRRNLERRLRVTDRQLRVIGDRAERLSVDDASIDTVVATLVLCTVDDPAQALREIARVLRPDGELLFIEHVRAASMRLARWQDRLAWPWQQFAVGCRCNRETLDLIYAAGFTVDAQPGSWTGMPPIVSPLIIGRATLPGPDNSRG